MRAGIAPGRTIPRSVLTALSATPRVSYAFHAGSTVEIVRGGALATSILAAARGLRSSGLRSRQVVPILGASSAALWAAFVGAMAADLVPCILPAPTFKTHMPTWARNVQTLVARYGTATIVAAAEVQGRLEAVEAGELAVLPLEGLFAAGPDRELPDDGAAVAFLQHSSGSTGVPKGVALTHQAVLGHLDAYAQSIELRREDRISSWLPLYHDMGLITSFLLPLAAGVGCDTLRPEDWILDPGRILAVMSAAGSTLAWWPNFTFNLLADRVRPSDAAQHDLARVRAIVNCSEPVLPTSHERFRERFARAGLRPAALQTCYALAENVFAATQSAPPGPAVLTVLGRSLEPGQTLEECRPDAPDAQSVMSSGRPVATVDVRIVSEQRTPLPEGCVGEIALGGPSLFSGYHDLPAAAVSGPQAGVYYTGDLGAMKGGELFVLGRRSDLIIVGGRNFYPSDIEGLAGEVEGIKEGRVVAFGILSEDKGTEDVVVLAESDRHGERAAVQAMKKEIRARVLQRLDCPVDVVTILPPRSLVKTSSGKIARRENRRRYLDGQTDRS